MRDGPSGLLVINNTCASGYSNRTLYETDFNRIVPLMSFARNDVFLILRRNGYVMFVHSYQHFDLSEIKSHVKLLHEKLKLLYRGSPHNIFIYD